MFGLFFQTLTPEQRASIRVVAGDGARWIDSCVHEWCPNAERAPDGFHIVSWTSDAPDNPRKQQKPQISPIHKQFDKLVEHLLSVTLMHPDDAPPVVVDDHGHARCLNESATPVRLEIA